MPFGYFVEQVLEMFIKLRKGDEQAHVRCMLLFPKLVFQVIVGGAGYLVKFSAQRIINFIQRKKTAENFISVCGAGKGAWKQPVEQGSGGGAA